MSNPLITVFGATGEQGGSVARSLLQKGGWRVRGVTRNPDSDKAKALKALGIEVVKASLDDKASVKEAVRGSHGVFLVTNFWELLDAARETKQGKDAADACVEEGVKHLIYSGLSPAKKLSGLSVPHLDAKAEVEDYLPTIGIPYTSVRYPFYYENLAGGFGLTQKQEDGSFLIVIPMETHPLYAMSVADGGPAVAEIFKNRDEYIGKLVGLAADYKPVGHYAAMITKHTTKTFKHADKLTSEEFAAFGFPAADEIANMFRYFQTDHFHRLKDVALTKKLNPCVQSFEDWVKANKERFESM
ncbi:nmrA-like family domain-containing protein 1 [Corticium candelabrum]|uniref:nmrA-like family domain-containing protein 1 n=1 Tax=Corticium candelabrum TaxID=121492 RepID=UPI002E259210|nr:nmrA-like family domain-containing protein 1 [Corticium candelabrum]